VPPAADEGARYAAPSINEARAGSLGNRRRLRRGTPDPTQIGLFWNPPIWVSWKPIAQTVISARHGTLSRRRRPTFRPRFDLTLADSGISASTDAKYT
jgi:hypothetical protein